MVAYGIPKTVVVLDTCRRQTSDESQHPKLIVLVSSDGAWLCAKRPAVHPGSVLTNQL